MILNNKLGHRSLKHENLFAAIIDDEQIIARFDGQTIPGVITVAREDYTKNGKWSYTAWTVAPVPGVAVFTITQDWETGRWLNSLRWWEAICEFQGKAAAIDGAMLPSLTPVAIERFIRVTWPKIAERLDTATVTEQIDGSVALRELLAAQQELATLRQEIAAREAEEAAQQEATAIRARVNAARAAMRNGASLADLKALLDVAG